MGFFGDMLFEIRVDVEAREFPGGTKRENQSGQRAEHQQRAQHAPIRRKVEFGKSIWHPCRHKRPEQVRRPGREQQTGRTAHQRQQQPFGQHLAQDAAAPGAQGQAYGHLLAPAHAPHEHHAGEVQAGNHQDQRGQAQSHRGHWSDHFVELTGRV